ncbi:prepilin-type N-terminal cleavage/methylation domain-containing protein, partial [Salmonella enterica]|nr:prepilin-type N-terminal cleavage/methylation domain-containing protein [Salmonella enterica]
MVKMNKGFTLIELILALGIGTAISFIKFKDMKTEQENIIAQAVGTQIKQIGEAVNRYISIHYDKLSTLSSS